MVSAAVFRFTQVNTEIMRTVNQIWHSEPSASSRDAALLPFPGMVADPATDSDVDGLGSTLRVQLLYEDAETGLRARHALDSLGPTLKQQADLEVDVWRFDALNDPGLRELACCELAEADILFLAAHGQAELPVQVRRHLEHWFAALPPEPRALVVSLDAVHKGSAMASRMLASLRDWATLAEVEVISHFSENGGMSGEPGREQQAHGVTSKSSMSEDFPSKRDAYAHWGLNE